MGLWMQLRKYNYMGLENIITWDYECIFTGLDINGCVPFQSEFINILHIVYKQNAFILLACLIATPFTGSQPVASPFILMSIISYNFM